MDSLTSILAPLSAIIGSGVTLFFTNKRERSKFMLEVKYKELKDFENLCVEIMSLLDRQVEQIKFGEFGDKSDLKSSNIIGRISLFATQEIVDKFRDSQYYLHIWSELYAKASPKRIGDSNHAYVSSEDIKYEKPAKDAYQDYFNSAIVLRDAMIGEIEKRKTLIIK